MKTSAGPGTILNRGDLLEAIGTGQHELAVLMAEQLGLVHEPVLEIHQQKAIPVVVDVSQDKNVSEADSTGYPKNIEDIALWLPTTFKKRTRLEEAPIDKATSYYRWTSPPEVVPQQTPLIPRNVLNSRLHAILSGKQFGSKVDLAKLIQRLARCELVRKLPLREKRSWCQDLCVIRDISPHLAPFDEDQDFIVQQLKLQLPSHDLRVLKGQNPFRLRPDQFDRHISDQQWEQPYPGSHVLVIGDLGLFRSESAIQAWRDWGRSLLERNCHPVAFVPCSVSKVPKSLLDIYQVESIQMIRAADSTGEERQRLLHELFVLCSSAIRIEPGLLRSLRSLIPGAADASLEIDFWKHQNLSSNHIVAATIDSHIANESLRPAFARLPRELRSKVLEKIRYWRTEIAYAPEIWFEEILSLDDDSKKLVSSQDLEDAYAMVLHFEHNRTQGVEDYQRRATAGRLSSAAYKDQEVGRFLLRTKLQMHPHDNAVHGANAQDGASGKTETIFCQIGDQSVSFSTEPVDPNVVAIQSSTKLIEIWIDSFWKSGVKPDFVSDFGRDRHGAWFEFQIPRRDSSGFVTQRMRWIPPGSFMMGSHKDEPERDSNENQHQVTLTKGFWLAETVCTQALWTAVMGENPSYFTGDNERPVEQVSYEDVSQFFEKVKKHLPELQLSFPTEAQWEYACRAGTQTPFHFGPQITTDQANFNGNYPYKNGGKGEYRQQTVASQEFSPNAWGLYQMHGNVREWCRDWYGDYPIAESVNPTGPDSGSDRVVRGGSWGNDARLLRSAYRNFNAPGHRSSRLGFRCMSSSSLAEPIEGAEVPVAEQGSERARAGEASNFVHEQTSLIRPEETTLVELSHPSSLILKSDLEEITIDRCPKPDWAVVYGQDQFGTYADFEIEYETKVIPRSFRSRVLKSLSRQQSAKTSTVRQRMRWIPPGTFMMGSPEDEPGRSDHEILHPVTISQGYWLFDTPCTQELWLAVMQRDNPSHFADLERPVEKIDWEQADEFAKTLTGWIGISFSLPTEAQWEYACRAGTSTALYSGPMEIRGNANAPALDQIAWYGGNSGHDYDLDQQVDVSGFSWISERQYDFQLAGTRKVKLKKPNPWGLYDMLGNVFEWCQDWYGDYTSGEQIDPTGPDNGSGRVVRGGSWNDYARGLRSAYRNGDDPGVRYDYLGFRCMSSPSQAEQVNASRAD